MPPQYTTAFGPPTPSVDRFIPRARCIWAVVPQPDDGQWTMDDGRWAMGYGLSSMVHRPNGTGAAPARYGRWTMRYCPSSNVQTALAASGPVLYHCIIRGWALT